MGASIPSVPVVEPYRLPPTHLHTTVPQAKELKVKEIEDEKNKPPAKRGRLQSFRDAARKAKGKVPHLLLLFFCFLFFL